MGNGQGFNPWRNEHGHFVRRVATDQMSQVNSGMLTGRYATKEFIASSNHGLKTRGYP